MDNKFDWDKACEGQPVVTRYGKDVTQIKFFDLAEPRKSILIGVVNNNVEAYNLDGTHRGSRHELDLFMKVKERWVNLYAGEMFKSAWIVGEYSSEEIARANRGPGYPIAMTIKLESN